MQSTHLNAFMEELQEAEQAALQASGRVSDLKRKINERRAEDGLEPLFDSNGKQIKGVEPTPEGADGFGVRPARTAEHKQTEQKAGK